MVRTQLIQQGGAFKNARLEVGLFLFGAVALASWYFSVYDFPVESGLKVLFGIGSLGTLISLDLALQAQVKHYPLTEYTKLPESMSHMGHSIATQLAILVIFIVLMLTTILAMVMIKDIHWLSENLGRVDEHMAKVSIIKEFVFVAIVLIAYKCTIMYHWLQLLRLLLDK
jgi:hypothetical protein